MNVRIISQSGGPVHYQEYAPDPSHRGMSYEEAQREYTYWNGKDTVYANALMAAMTAWDLACTDPNA